MKVFLPTLLLKDPIKACEMIAPISEAALIPGPVQWPYRLGKTSPGTMKVVVLGPKFGNKFARQYGATRPDKRLKKSNPMTEKRMVKIPNPRICIGLRPMVSINATENQ
jgi:hypothetical protein